MHPGSTKLLRVVSDICVLVPTQAFAPEMLEEARRSATKRSTEATGPHTLSFAERAAMYAVGG